MSGATAVATYELSKRYSRDTALDAINLRALIVLALVGLVAGAIPASRAARTNPATVLREG